MGGCKLILPHLGRCTKKEEGISIMENRPYTYPETVGICILASAFVAITPAFLGGIYYSIPLFVISGLCSGIGATIGYFTKSRAWVWFEAFAGASFAFVMIILFFVVAMIIGQSNA